MRYFDLKKLLIFDLDGTLADTIESIRHAVNLALSKFGYPQKSYDEIRAAIGDGALLLMKRVLPDSVSRDDTFVRDFLRLYEDMYDTTYSEADRCYNGIVDTLKVLRSRGYTIAVLSNKQDKYVKQIAEKILPEGIVSIALGQCEGCPTKPDPTAALTISCQLGFRATDTAMIGDGETDIMTAKNAGMLSVGCAWGYRGRDTLKKHGADHIRRPHNIKMIKQKNLSPLIVILLIIGIIWNIYSYFCIGVIHRYDLYEILPAESVNILWISFICCIVVNMTLSGVSILQTLTKRDKMIQWNFRICIAIYFFLILSLEYNCKELSQDFPNSKDIVSSILKHGYYSYIFISVILLIILSVINKIKMHYYSHSNSSSDWH